MVHTKEAYWLNMLQTQINLLHILESSEGLERQYFHISVHKCEKTVLALYLGLYHSFSESSGFGILPSA